MKVKEATDFLPYEYIGDNYCITSFGTVVFGVQMTMVEAFTMQAGSDRMEQEEQGDRIVVSESDSWFHNYKGALSALPQCSVQKITEIYTLNHKRIDSGGSRTRRWNEDMFLKRDIVFCNNYLFVSFQLKEAINKKGLFDSLIKRVKKFEGVTDLNSYERQFRSFYSSLESSVKEIRQLSGEEILSKFIDGWNHDLENEESGDVLQDVSVLPNGLVFGNKFRNVLSSRNLPEQLNGFSGTNTQITESTKLDANNTVYRSDIKLPTSFLFPLGMGFPYKHTLIETIEICDKETIDRELTKANTSLNLLVTFNNRDAIKKRNHINSYKENASEQDYRYVKYGLTIILENENLETLNKLTDQLVDVGRKTLGLILNVENRGAWKQFYSSLPGCGYLNTNLRYGFLEIISYMTHIEGFKRSNSKGIMMVDLLGNPFLFDDWDEKNRYLEARNGMVFGPTGGGKSFTVNHMLDSAYHNGDFIFIIDVGGSYRRITKLLGGEYVDSTNIELMTFNPFQDCFQKNGVYYPELGSDGEKDPLYLDKMASLICSCWDADGKITSETYTTIRKTIGGYFQVYNSSKTDLELNFNGYYEYVLSLKNGDESKAYSTFLNFESFELMMESFYKGGEYEFLLNAERTLNINNRWMCFDLKGVLNNRRLTAPVLLMVIQLFENGMQRWYGNPCRMYLEEAIDFLQGGFFADYIASLYRKIRKMGGQVMIVTQSISFLSKLDPMVKSSILANSSIKILLDHSKNVLDYPTLEEELSLTKSEMELLKNQRPSEGAPYRLAFMKFGSMPGFLFRVEVSQKTYALYQTNAQEIKMIDELIEASGVEAGVQNYVELNTKE